METKEPVHIIDKTNDLESGLRTGRYPCRFILETMRSEEWYGAYVTLGKRLEDHAVLRSLINDMLRHCSVKYESGKSDMVFCGVDRFGTKVLHLLSNKGKSQYRMLSLDDDAVLIEKSPGCCRTIQLSMAQMLLYTYNEKNQPVALSWGGVHEGSYAFHVFCGLANLDILADEFRRYQTIFLISFSADYREQGLVPVLIALCQALNVQSRIYAGLPIRLKHAPRFTARAYDAVEKWKAETFVKVHDPEMDLNNPECRGMSLQDYFSHTENWIAQTILEDIER